MTHLVLLGDSIFDNGAYVGSGPDVIHQLRSILPAGWRATLNAVDGAGMADIRGQIARLPPDASHLVVSVGGNDALAEAGVLEEKTNFIAEALDTLVAVRERFQQAYGASRCWGACFRARFARYTKPAFPILIFADGPRLR